MPSPAVADDADAALDLNDVARGDGFLFVRDGVGLAGRGVAARVVDGRAAGAAGAIEHDDRDRRRADVCPVAFGSLPFDPAQPRRADRAGA